MLLAHQFADALVLLTEGQHGRSGAAVAHLVDQAGQRHVVPRPQRAVVVHAELGHDEQRDALDPRRPAGNLGQHQMHDVFREFVVAAGNEDLVAAQGIRAVRVRRGAGGDVGQARSGLRFGQGHGAEEAAGEQRLQVLLFLRLAAEAVDDVGVADGEEGIGRGADVGALEQRERRLRHDHRQLHAAAFEVVCRGDEAGFAEGLQCLPDLGDHAHALAVEGRFVGVGLVVVRFELLGRHRLGRVEHGAEGFLAVLGVARAGGQGLGIKDLEKLEVEVAAVDDAAHGAAGPPQGAMNSTNRKPRSG